MEGSVPPTVMKPSMRGNYGTCPDVAFVKPGLAWALDTGHLCGCAQWQV